MSNGLAITLVHGAGAAGHAAALQAKYGAAAARTDPASVADGDLLLLDGLDGLTWIGTNVLLLAGNRAPIVTLIPLADALA